MGGQCSNQNASKSQIIIGDSKNLFMSYENNMVHQDSHYHLIEQREHIDTKNGNDSNKQSSMY